MRPLEYYFTRLGKRDCRYRHCGGWGLHDCFSRKYAELYTKRICCIAVEPVTCFGALDFKVTYGYARKLVGNILESTTQDNLL